MTNQPTTILHVDMDAFFAAIEQFDRPELRGRPVIVGSAPDARGVVCTASYEARKYGVRSAMPSRTAFRLCPHGVFLPVRRERYSEVSASVMRVFRSITPIVEQVSIDEAFLDVAGVQSRWGDPIDISCEIKRRLRQQTGLTGSIGVASNKFLAKLASDMRKPDGLTIVPADQEQILAFLAPLPASRLWGVGKATAERLADRGVTQVAQLQAMALDEAVAMLGASLGNHLWHLARGLDERRVDPEPRTEKSISHEDTFPHDVTEFRLIRQTLLEQAEKVGRRLRKADMLATVGHLKLRFGDFRTITRQKRLPRVTCMDRDLLACALELLAAETLNRPVRLIGFGVSGLQTRADQDPNGQMLLFDETQTEEARRERALDDTVDSLREMFGEGIIRRGIW